MSIPGSFNYAMSALGLGQTYQNLTSSRVSGTLYTNSTDRPICVFIQYASGGIIAVVNGVTLPNTNSANNNTITAYSFIVPPGNTYSAIVAISLWVELR